MISKLLSAAASVMLTLGLALPALADQTPIGDLHLDVNAGYYIFSVPTRNEANVLQAGLTLTDEINKEFSVYGSFDDSAVNRSDSEVLAGAHYTRSTYDVGVRYKFNKNLSLAIQEGTALRVNTFPANGLVNRYIGATVTTRVF